jgi:hypothetical protein
MSRIRPFSPDLGHGKYGTLIFIVLLIDGCSGISSSLSNTTNCCLQKMHSTITLAVILIKPQVNYITYTSIWKRVLLQLMLHACVLDVKFTGPFYKKYSL